MDKNKIRFYSQTNKNMLWGHVAAETLSKLGLNFAVISPGSRSAPLTIGFTQNQKIKSITILDERSAGFFGLGKSMQSNTAVLLICSSGTATANLYPAVIEASLSNIPLLIFTADRPGELQECHAPQTINQKKIFGNYTRWQIDLNTPKAEINAFRYLRQSLMHALSRTKYPSPGPVHVNFPFRDPLVPIKDEKIYTLREKVNKSNFYSHISPLNNSLYTITPNIDLKKRLKLYLYKKGIIIIGPTIVQNCTVFSKCIASIAYSLGWPVITDVLNPLRNFKDENQYLICHYDIFLRNENIRKKLKPDCVLAIGALPTSKILSEWLTKIDVITYLINKNYDNWDPYHRRVCHVYAELNFFEKIFFKKQIKLPSYTKSWLNYDKKISLSIDRLMKKQNFLFEGKIPWILSKFLPTHTPFHIGNSMPIRDAECFWRSNNKQIIPNFNRGANGIDGTISSGMGMAFNNRPSVLLTGDLSFLHDTNGLLVSKELQGSLTIIVINNQGGRIFNNLPIAKFNFICERYFVTPQNINIEKLAEAYSIPCYVPKKWIGVVSHIKQLPSLGVKIILINTNQKKDITFRKNIIKKLANNY